MNEYDRAFVDHMSRLGLKGTNFAKLTKEVFEAKFGGGGDALLKGWTQETLEDPERFASEVHRIFGMGALQYYVLIVRYLNAGRFNPEREAEEDVEEERLESIVNQMDANSDYAVESDELTTAQKEAVQATAPLARYSGALA